MLGIKAAKADHAKTLDAWQRLEQEIRIRFSDDNKFIIAATQHILGTPKRKSWYTKEYLSLNQF